VAETYSIQFVAAVEPCPGGTRLRFRNGTLALVPATHPDRDLFLLLVDHSLRMGCPVGVVLDEAGSVVDLNHTYQSQVHRIQNDPEDDNRLEVGFWAVSPVCHLTRDHPDFTRILRTLNDAVATEAPVWLANRSQPVVSETVIWLKLLDVRPVAELAPARSTESMGTAAQDTNGVARPSRAQTESPAAPAD
jgi:hypothetical protein